jgi:hypothetical protein
MWQASEAPSIEERSITPYVDNSIEVKAMKSTRENKGLEKEKQEKEE